MSNQTSFQRILAFIVIGIGLIAVGVAAMALLTMRQTQVGREISAIPAKVNYAAPSLTLNDLEGKPHSLDDYLGQVVLVNLWATWCPPCLEEMPVFEGFYRDYSASGFLIIAINDGDPLSDVQEFVENYGLTFPVWSDPEYLTEQTFETMNLPSSYVIDRQGRVRLRWVGAISRAMLEKYVLPIIEEK